MRPTTAHDIIRRDELILALGWAAALRAGELVALDVADLAFTDDPGSADGAAMLVRIRKSRADQRQKVEYFAVPASSTSNACPVRLGASAARRLRTGPLFRRIDRHGCVLGRLNADSVSTIVRDAVGDVLHVPDEVYSGHSLRAGFVTQARLDGLADELIARHCRLHSPKHARSTTRPPNSSTSQP